TFTGAVSGTLAEIDVTFTIAVSQAGWVGVPLRLNTAVLREPPTFTGPGEHILHFDSKADGYVAWINAEPGESQQVSLKVRAALTSLGAESRLRLHVPRATLAQMDLQ